MQVVGFIKLIRIMVFVYRKYVAVGLLNQVHALSQLSTWVDRGYSFYA